MYFKLDLNLHKFIYAQLIESLVYKDACEKNRYRIRYTGGIGKTGR